MEDTSGFYKNDSGELLYGKNYVLSGSYNLYRENKDDYAYPIGGWFWFDSEEQAREAFHLTKKEEPLPHWSELKPPIGFEYPPNFNISN